MKDEVADVFYICSAVRPFLPIDCKQERLFGLKLRKNLLLHLRAEAWIGMAPFSL